MERWNRGMQTDCRKKNQHSLPSAHQTTAEGGQRAPSMTDRANDHRAGKLPSVCYPCQTPQLCRIAQADGQICERETDDEGESKSVGRCFSL